MKYIILAVFSLFLGLTNPAYAAAPAISLLQAVEKAEQALNGQVVEAELERDRQGRLIYGVEVAQDNALHKMKIDARTGQTLGTSYKRMESWGWRIYGSKFKSLKQARKLSTIIRGLEKRSGDKVTEVDFEVEGGQARYEVKLSTDAGIAKLYIDPKTGERLDFVIDD